MKYIISESQLEKIKDNLLKLPFSAFNNDWDLLQEFLERKGNPPYILKGDVHLSEHEEITTLGNLISVEGYLNLFNTSIHSLENLISVKSSLFFNKTPIFSLGNLTSVGGDLFLRNSPIKYLGNLKSVGGTLDLINTPISYMYSEEEIRNMIKVGDLYL
jgi:hypothetical protein